MVQSPDEKTSELHFFGQMVPLLPSLMLRLGGVFFKFKREARKGGKIFYKELLRQGLDEKTSEELTKLYLESSNISNFIKMFK
jgi:hypothetical protein